MADKLTTEEFILKSQGVHGDKYSYDNAEYINIVTKLSITCGVHGDFKQTPESHYKGHGCKLCGQKRSSTEGFISKAIKEHGDKYDYALVKVVDSKTKVKIKCPIHGEFLQVPHNHIKTGCHKCAKTSNTSDFIRKAKAIHGNKYDYSLVKYELSNKPVVIKCLIHGNFHKTPSTHLIGSGCNKCYKEELPVPLHLKGKMARVYYIRIEKKDVVVYKIGVTTREINKRFKDNMRNITVVSISDYMMGEVAFGFEQAIIQRFKDFKYNGEKLLVRAGTDEMFTKDVLGLYK